MYRLLGADGRGDAVLERRFASARLRMYSVVFLLLVTHLCVGDQEVTIANGSTRTQR